VKAFSQKPGEAWLPSKLLKSWFAKCKVELSTESSEELADSLRRLWNKHRNEQLVAEARARGTSAHAIKSKLKDVDPVDFWRWDDDDVAESAGDLLAKLDEVASFRGAGASVNGSDVTVAELQDILRRAFVHPRRKVPPTSKRGRPENQHYPLARRFAKAIAGTTGLNFKTATVAFVTSKLISRATGDDSFTINSFAKAMKDRTGEKRRQKDGKKHDEFVEDVVKRIKVGDE
jgi:hypothetical protein